MCVDIHWNEGLPDHVIILCEGHSWPHVINYENNKGLVKREAP